MRKRRITAVLTAGLVLAGVLGNSLMLTAESVPTTPICGLQEHIHTEECYTTIEPSVLNCVSADPNVQNVHIHTVDCYAKDEHGNPYGYPICGYAGFILHRHTEACYNSQNQLICPLPETFGHRHSDVTPHVHTAECYNSDGKLICPLEENVVPENPCYQMQKVLVCGQEERPAVPAHYHTADCYTLVNTGKLICGQTESAADPGHVHTEDCYEHVWKLTCGQEETAGDPGHTHTDSCYVEQKVLVCQQHENWCPHVHTDACYARDEYGNLTGELICGMDVLYEHVHTADCFPETEKVLTCSIPEHIHTQDCYLDGSSLLLPQNTLINGENVLTQQEGGIYDPSELTVQNQGSAEQEQQTVQDGTVPVYETPATQEDTSLNPVFESPAAQDASSTTPVFETPVTQDTASTTPVFETPVTQDTASTTPVFETPVTQDTASTTPVFETPAAQDSASLNPVFENPAGQTSDSLTPAYENQNADPSNPLQPVFEDSNSIEAQAAAGYIEPVTESSADTGLQQVQNAAEPVVQGQDAAAPAEQPSDSQDYLNTIAATINESQSGKAYETESSGASSTTSAVKDAMARVQAGSSSTAPAADTTPAAETGQTEVDEMTQVLNDAIEAIKNGTLHGTVNSKAEPETEEKAETVVEAESEVESEKETEAAEASTEAPAEAESEEEAEPAGEAESEVESEAETEAAAEEESEAESEAAEEMPVRIDAGHVVKKDLSEVNAADTGLDVSSSWIGNVNMETGGAVESAVEEADEKETETILETNVAGFDGGAVQSSDMVWETADTESVISVKADQKLRFDLTVEVPAGVLSAANNTLIYQVPAQIRAIDEEAGAIQDSDGNTVAEYRTFADGRIAISFSEDYAELNAGGAVISATVNFTTSVDNLAWEENTND